MVYGCHDKAHWQLLLEPESKLQLLNETPVHLRWAKLKVCKTVWKLDLCCTIVLYVSFIGTTEHVTLLAEIARKPAKTPFKPDSFMASREQELFLGIE